MLINHEQWNKNSMSMCFCFYVCLLLGYLYVSIFPAMCGRMLTLLPCAAQRGGLVNTGVISKSSFELNGFFLLFFFPYCCWSDHLSGVVFTSCLLKLMHYSGNRLHWPAILSSNWLLLSVLGCLRGQLRGLINEWCSFGCQQMPAVLCWFQFPGDPALLPASALPHLWMSAWSRSLTSC